MMRNNGAIEIVPVRSATWLGLHGEKNVGSAPRVCSEILSLANFAAVNAVSELRYFYQMVQLQNPVLVCFARQMSAMKF